MPLPTPGQVGQALTAGASALSERASDKDALHPEYVEGVVDVVAALLGLNGSEEEHTVVRDVLHALAETTGRWA